MDSRYELYIGGQLCDLGEDAKIAFRFQSSMLSELDTLAGNSSWTIHLPFTPTNRRIWGFCERPDVVTQKPYRRQHAALYIDGLDIFTAGTCYLSDIDDTGYNVFVTWGVIETLKGFFENDMRDLAPVLYDMDIGNIAWDKDTIIAGNDLAVEFLPIRFGGPAVSRESQDKRYNHPSVSVAALLDAMERYRPSTSDDPDTSDEDAPPAIGAFPEKTELLRRLTSGRGMLYLPLTSLNGDVQSGIKEKETGRCALDVTITSGVKDRRFKFVSNIYGYAKDYNFDVKGAEAVYISLGDFTINYQQSNNGNLFNSPDEAREYMDAVMESLAIQVVHVDDAKHVTTVYGSLSIEKTLRITYGSVQNRTYISNAYIHISQRNKPEIFALGDEHNYDDISLYIAGTLSGRVPAIILDAPSYIMYATPRDECRYPTLYPVGANLPDVSIGEFLLSLLTMSGMFAYLDIAGALHFASWAKIEENRRAGKVYDWSDRVILDTAREVSRPRASRFNTDDWAQRNILDYDNDDDVTSNTEGILRIDNRNIANSRENTVIFSASENRNEGEVNYVLGNTAYIPIYDDKGNHSDVSPRIVRSQSLDNITDANGTEILAYHAGVFTSDMRFGGAQGIVATKYPELQHILDSFRIVTVQMLLPWAVLRQIDYTRPVFLAELGRYYAIKSIQTGDNNLCECELIQLP